MSRYFVFALVGLSLLVSAISSTAVSVAFPVITSSFNASLILAGWVLSVYQLVSTAAVPLAGKAGDIFGGKRTFMISLSIFLIGSLLSALAPNIYFLILARVIQAVGGGSFLPLGARIVADEFPRARQRAIGLFTSIISFGQIIGPNLGGWMVHVYGWRSIFWLNVPLGCIALIASVFLLRPSQREEGNIDLVGASLFTTSLFTFMIGLSEMGNSDEKSSWLLSGLLFVAVAVLVTTFLRHEGSTRSPIIDLRVLKERPFWAANTYNLIFGALLFGTASFIPLYAVSVHHMSTVDSGLILTPMSAGALVASMVTSIFLPQWGYRWPMLVGTGTMVLSLFLLGIQPSSVALLAAIVLLMGIGMGTTAPAANNACIELMPQRVATITGMRVMFRQSGGAISIAVISLLLHNIGDMAYGFTIVFGGLAIAMVVAAPFIFLMPRSPEQSPLDKDASRD